MEVEFLPRYQAGFGFDSSKHHFITISQLIILAMTDLDGHHVVADTIVTQWSEL